MTQTVTQTLEQLKQLTDAEEYFQFFHLDYDPKVVSINRLHILKQFSKYMEEIDVNYPEMGEADRLSRYKEALLQAYDVFLTTSPLQTKLFKVFNEKPQNIVMLGEIS